MYLTNILLLFEFCLFPAYSATTVLFRPKRMSRVTDPRPSNVLSHLSRVTGAPSASDSLYWMSHFRRASGAPYFPPQSGLCHRSRPSPPVVRFGWFVSQSQAHPLWSKNYSTASRGITCWELSLAPRRRDHTSERHVVCFCSA